MRTLKFGDRGELEHRIRSGARPCVDNCVDPAVVGRGQRKQMIVRIDND